jgi:hypothetical protein
MATPPEEIETQLKKWSQQITLFRLLHVALGIVAIVSSLLVAARLTFFEIPTEWLAFTAAVSVGLMLAFNLGAKANLMRRAWRLLNTAMLTYKHETKPDVTELIEAYAQAEAIIGDVKAEVK